MNDQSDAEDMADFRKKIASDGSYARKRIYGGPKTQSMQPVKATEMATAVILVGYCPDTLAYFNAMFDEARKSFPDLKACDVTCGKVIRSESVKGFTVILFAVPDVPVDSWDYYNSHVDFNY